MWIPRWINSTRYIRDKALSTLNLKQWGYTITVLWSGYFFKIYNDYILQSKITPYQRDDQPVATLRMRRLVSLIIGLCVNLVSATTVVLWHRSTSLSSCFCRRTKISSSSTTCRSIGFWRGIRHVNEPSNIILRRVRSKFCKRERDKLYHSHNFDKHKKEFVF